MAACFEYYADLAEKLDGRQWQPVELGEEGFKSEIRREPLGAVSACSLGTVQSHVHCCVAHETFKALQGCRQRLECVFIRAAGRSHQSVELSSSDVRVLLLVFFHILVHVSVSV